MAFDYSEICNLASKYNSQVVGYYDSTLNRLSGRLYRIDGFSITITTTWQPIRIYLMPIDDDQQGRQVTVMPEDVITYDELVYIYRNTLELFDKSSEIFKGCFTKSIMPLKTDRDTLKSLLDQYIKRGLIIEEDSKCAIITE